MIELTNYDFYNFENAIRGMRNPMNSWERSDSISEIDSPDGLFKLGDKDKDLAQRLIDGGSVNSKFLRQIFVSVDINAPLYWWKEMDQYRIGCTTNSCSTMHKLSTTPITKDLFSFPALPARENAQEYSVIDEELIPFLEHLRQLYLETNDKRYWDYLIAALPEGWNQKRTWTADYEVLRSIYYWRRNHKLGEWRSFCEWIEQSVPYSKELITYNKER